MEGVIEILWIKWTSSCTEVNGGKIHNDRVQVMLTNNIWKKDTGGLTFH